MKLIGTLFIVFNTLICLSAYGQAGNRDYPEADAVYLQLNKTYVLNRDGSMVSKVEKRQKLLTHRAFQSLFGETRITYNPQFQKVVVNQSYTENGQREKIETPQNGFNEVLPAFGNNLKAFSHLREMVITHTGLELGSVINCSYEIKSIAGMIPWLLGDEPIHSDCPIERLNITIKVPVGTSLKYKLLKVKLDPKIERTDEYVSYTWQFKDVLQRNKEPFSSDYVNLPRLLFSTQAEDESVIKWLKNQDAFKLPVGDETKKYIDHQISKKKTTLQKALRIQEIVVKELNLAQIPPNQLAFHVRTPEEIWKSNSGTTLEKCCLLSAILKSEGIKSDLCLVVPKNFIKENIPFLLAADPVVRLSSEREGTLLLSSERLNSGNFDLCSDQQMLLSTEIETSEISDGAGKIEVVGTFEISMDERISGSINGNFTNRFNPYLDIIRNEGKTMKLFAGTTGTSENETPEKTTINFVIDKTNSLTTRGNFKFLDLFESGVGISSLHLTPLPFKRNSTLVLGSAISESYSYSITVPKTFHLVNPVDTTLITGQTGKLMLRFFQKDQLISIKKELQIFKSTIPIESYPEFRKLINIWISPKSSKLILKTE